jgi:WD40 repeat protein
MESDGVWSSGDFVAVEIRLLPLPSTGTRRSSPVNGSAPITGTSSYSAELSVDRWRGFDRIQVHINFDTLLTQSAAPDGYGEALGRMLFAADGLRAPYTQALGHSRGKMRVRLRLEPTELQGLHWERIYHPLNAHWQPLSSTADTPLSRFVLAQQWERPLPVDQQPLRLLAVISSPTNADQYRLDPISAEERAALHAMLDSLPGIKISYLERDAESHDSRPPTLRNLRQALGRGYHLVHFLCHGARTPRGAVLFLEKDDGSVGRVTQDELVQAFQAVAVRPALTFLAACESARRGRQDAAASLGHALVEHGGVQAVVGMTDKVGIATAQLFSAEFYARLLEHGTVDLAANQARAVVQDTWDWGTPVLFTRLADSYLLFRTGGGVSVPSETGPTVAELLRRRWQREDWGEARRGEELQGRELESARLRTWIEVDQCRLIGVYGLGGMGKTALATSVAKEVQNSFECLYWRSLQNEYKPEEYLRHSIQFVLTQPLATLPDDFETLLTLFIDTLLARRCLLILDNMETVMEPGRTGSYRRGYEGYGKLLQSASSVAHNSCIVVTSREKVPEIGVTDQGLVRALELTGLDQAAARELVLRENPSTWGTDEDWTALAQMIGGIPLGLKVVADYVRRLFGGDLGQFLSKSEAVIERLEDILQQQMDRLSALERQVLTWLAIEREPVSVDDLQEDILPLPGIVADDLMASMVSLQRTSMVETRPGGRFGLQPVIMEFVTHALVEQVCREVEDDKLDTLALYSLVKARSKEYIRDTQTRLILSPIAEKLENIYGQQGAERKVARLLGALRQVDPLVAPHIQRGYGAANCLNLLHRLGANLTGTDFASTVVRQADLQQTALKNVSFAHATFESSLFRANFTGIISLAFDRTGDTLATGTSAGEIWLWQIASTSQHGSDPQSELIHSLDLIPWRVLEAHSDMVRSVSFSSDSALLASGGEEGTVALWELETGRLRWRAAGDGNQVFTVALSPDGNIVASGGDKHDVQVWDAATGARVRSLSGHSDKVTSVAFSADGTLLASGSEDHTVRVWDVRSGQSLHTLSGHHTAVDWVSFAPHGTLLTSTSSDQVTRFWDGRTGRSQSTLSRTSDAQIGCVIFGHGGGIAASIGDEHTVRLWSLSDGRALASLTSPYRINVADLSPDGRLLAFGGEDHTVQLWEIGTAQCLRVMHGYSNYLKAVVFSADGRFLASCGDDKVIRFWDVVSSACLQSFSGHAGHIRSVALNSDGSLLASCSDDGTINLWEPINGRLLKTLRGHSRRVWDVVFSPNGRRLASGSFDYSIRLWDIETASSKVCEGHRGFVRSLAFSPDGAVLASSSDDHTARLWDVETGNALHIAEGHTDVVWDVTFSHDGRLLASASGDGTIKLWKAGSGQLLDTLSGHQGPVWSVAFSPDGALLASSGSDTTVRLWPVARWSFTLVRRLALNWFARRVGRAQASHILEGHSDFVRSLAFHPGGDILASCSHDGTIQLWSMNNLPDARRLRADKPYEGMDITETTGLTPAQRRAMKALGAVEKSGERV